MTSSSVTKPADVRGRDAEWTALHDFASASNPVGAVGLLYGRRRTGKSFLLRRLVESLGGIYFQATESERPDALVEFGNAVASEAVANPQAAEPIVYSDWDDAFRRRSGIIVIDEFPYLLRHSPELPSLLQRIIDEALNSVRPPIRFVLCGSSLSVIARCCEARSRSGGGPRSTCSCGQWTTARPPTSGASMISTWQFESTPFSAERQATGP